MEPRQTGEIVRATLVGDRGPPFRTRRQPNAFAVRTDTAIRERLSDDRVPLAIGVVGGDEQGGLADLPERVALPQLDTALRTVTSAWVACAATAAAVLVHGDRAPKVTLHVAPHRDLELRPAIVTDSSEVTEQRTPLRPTTRPTKTLSEREPSARLFRGSKV